MSVVIFWHFPNVSAAFASVGQPETCGGTAATGCPPLPPQDGCLPLMGGVCSHRETLTQLTRGSAASESTCTRIHMKILIRRIITTRRPPPLLPPIIYPKARPPDLVSHCSFGELSKPSFTVKRHERHLTLLLSW